MTKMATKLRYNPIINRIINRNNFSKWEIIALVVISLILTISVLYNYVDKPIVYFFHSLNTRQYKILHYIAEIPAAMLFLAPIALLYLIIKFLLGKSNHSDGLYYILVMTLSVGFTVRETLKYLFSRSWPDTFYDNPSLIVHNVYGFHWLSFSSIHRSFPSGHMIAISSVAVVLYLLYPRFRAISLALALFVGMSQMALYYHFASDIIAGVFIGGVIGYYITLTHPFYQLHKNKFEKLPV